MKDFVEPLVSICGVFLVLLLFAKMFTGCQPPVYEWETELDRLQEKVEKEDSVLHSKIVYLQENRHTMHEDEFDEVYYDISADLECLTDDISVLKENIREYAPGD